MSNVENLNLIYYTEAGRFFPTSLYAHLQATLGDMMAQPVLPPTDFVKQYSKQMQKALIDIGFWKCCLNCEFWSNNSAERKDGPAVLICHKWSAPPPPDFIVLGCDEWRCIVPF